MNVERTLSLRQGLELRPVPTREQLPPALQCQRPARERRPLRGTLGEHWKPLSGVLSRGDSIGARPGGALSTFEPSGHRHDKLLVPPSTVTSPEVQERA